MSLLAAAGALTHSLWNLNTVEPGFRTDNVLGFSLSVPSDHSMDERKRFYLNALDEVQNIPGVISAGWITFLPPETRAGVFMGLNLPGAPALAKGAPPAVANHLITSSGYFTTMGIAMARGREFSVSDTAQSPPVVVVNEAFARKYFPGEDALGKRMGTGFGGRDLMREIVGIVRDTHDRGLAVDAIPTVYLPLSQFALPYGSIALRSRVAPDTLIPEIRRRLARLDPSIPLTDFQAVSERMYKSIEEPRFYTLMACACALMAVIFVALGLYGIVSFSVSRRTAEFGIRMAVGAQQAAILRLVLLQGLRMVIAGIAIGLLLSLTFSQALSSLLFEVKPVDGFTLAAAALLVMLVTLLASYLPARRASLVNPIAALRDEN